MALCPVLTAAGQTQTATGSATLQGTVRDAQRRPVSGATIELTTAGNKERLSAQTDASGVYRFSSLAAGAYSLRVEKPQVGKANLGPVALTRGELKTIDLTLEPSPESSGANAPQFFDQPQFTVAGVTDTTSLGGHGSDTVVRSREALAKQTAGLGKEPSATRSAKISADENALREAVKLRPSDFAANLYLGRFLAGRGRPKEAVPYLERAAQLRDVAEVHNLLGRVDEQAGDPLEAVRQFQRAAELNPSESNLFDWGGELLLHRAAGPAIEVFAKGAQLFPRSVRMKIGLGAARYASGATADAVRIICEASDLKPFDPDPYLFLGRIQATESNVPEEAAEKLRRFAELQPANAQANYYYAVSLWKHRNTVQDSNDLAQVESLLQKAIHLNPKMGEAWLQLGILDAERKDLPGAISAYQEALAVTPKLEEAHYRLAQIYRQRGENLQANEQIEIYEQLAKEDAAEQDRERHEIKQFVYKLRDDSPAPPQK